jgi:hypothetical protein
MTKNRHSMPLPAAAEWSQGEKPPPAQEPRGARRSVTCPASHSQRSSAEARIA